jgi:hypothetical protein
VLQLDERDFSITADNAKDVCQSHGGAYTHDWYLSTAFSTKIGEKQYRANDASVRRAFDLLLTLCLAKVERGLEDAAWQQSSMIQRPSVAPVRKTKRPSK